MKKLQTLLLLAIILPAFLSCSAKSAENKESIENKEALVTKQINVYYFHFTRRCSTCINVENTTLEILQEVYANEMEDKLITFQAVNLDEPSSNELAEKLGISGQTLLLTNGKEKIDITGDGFMYANSNPEKLKEIIKKKINELTIE